jgi:hypothetical protein
MSWKTHKREKCKDNEMKNKRMLGHQEEKKNLPVVKTPNLEMELHIFLLHRNNRALVIILTSNA